ncbi:aminopeptidase N [Micropruina sonneratiae]|uniref:aminopeptidase N n=1 Tax=Micropruina sonneratiae TaxID=2986940 RepID=UPI002227BA4C|nr:aminopeptidase N [Micropruina sp. KQZ13P-5]MCW3158247.1 aminopeptidase N [Micropruina sp. KQZ13P-5]
MYPANITRDEARSRSALLSTDRYHVTVDLTGSPTTFTSTTTITFTSEVGRTFVDLIADSIIDATLDDTPLDTTGFDGERLGLDIRAGEHTLAITAVCRYSNTGEGLHRFVDPVDGRIYLYTQLEVADARRVFACFEQPDLKASFEFSVIAPAHWTVLSNSPETEPIVSGDLGRWDFAPTPRISTYITALIAGEYHTVRTTYTGREGEIPFSLSCRASMAPYLDAERLFTTTSRGFDLFEQEFGEPYPFSDYAQVFVPEFNAGAMENAGCVTIRDEYLYRSRVTAASYESRNNTILHELAHMWFGDLVTMTWWDDLWLNESFAEWASHFAQDEIRKRYGGNDPWATFCNQRKTWAYRQDQLPSTHPIAADMVDLQAVELNFDGITYAKGASALRQLVAFVGLEPFLAGVRTYFARHAWGNTTLADLLRALEESSGRDLAFFTGQWLQTAGVNTLTSDYEIDADGRFTRFTVVQHAPAQWPTLRRHRIGIGCYDADADGIDRVHHVELDIDGERTDVPSLVGVPAPAVVLLNDGDLSYAKIRIDRGLDVVVDRIHDFHDPVARALLWGATWDMCRDAQLSASDYADLVVRGVAVETDLTAVTAVLAQAESAVRYYTPPQSRASVAARWTAGLARLLKQAEPGSDHQLAIVRALAVSLTTKDGAALLRAWLAGEEVPPGLVVDADLRWRLVTQLARLGGLDEAGIDAELARDNTATGAEKAAGARAARPDADAKSVAWQLATEDPSVPNETHTQLCLNFWQLDQDSELKPYLDAWFEVMGDIAAQRNGWGHRSLAIRRNVGELLFPRPFGDRSLLARIDDWMAETELNDSVRRMVSERRDDVERALRCQEAAN